MAFPPSIDLPQLNGDKGQAQSAEAIASSQADAIREAARKELALQAAVLEAERAARVSEEFFSNISHDMRTPLAAIVGLSLLLERGTQISDMQRLEYNTAIYNAGQHLLGLVNDLLDVAKLKAGKLQLDLAPMNLVEVLQECASLQAPFCTQKGLRFSLQLNPNLPIAVLGDAMRIRQIVLNLLNNACKYTTTGEVNLFAETLSIVQNDCKIRIIVRDTGPGIPPEEVRRLFTRFATGSSVASSRRTGLGLSIVRQLCDLMGGDVIARSQVGLGSEFAVHISLPRADPSDLIPKYTMAIPQVRQESAAARIMVVDDLEVNQDIMLGVLKEMGFTNVGVASNGKAALELTEAAWPVFVLMDIFMPEMDGIDCAAELRKRPRGKALAIVATSASMIDPFRWGAAATLFDATLPKPFTPEQLHHVITQLTAIKFEDHPSAITKVLVVDDQPIMRRVTQLELSKGGFHVSSCATGEEALQRILNESHDVVLTDRLMPGLSGLELAKHLRTTLANQAPPIILMSADLGSEVRSLVAAGELAGAIEKPVKLADFVHVLERARRMSPTPPLHSSP